MAIAVLEADDLADLLGDAGELARRLLPSLGPAASFLSLYLEESGVPLPLPGDVFVLYLGHLAASSAWALLAVWLGLVGTVVAGSSNLYWVSRRWGLPLLRGRVGALPHITPEGLARAERLYGRWGAPALVLGRHIFGLRVPLTVAAGILRLPYPVFAGSVAVSTAVWAAIWLALGIHFGGRMIGFVHVPRWAYLLLPAGFVALLSWTLMRRLEERWRRSR